MKNTRLLLLGHGRSGKDSLAEFWRGEFGLTFKSSSEAAAEIFIYDMLKEKYGYDNFQQCYEDRRNKRVEWHDLITAYNTPDKTRLAREILKLSGCYVGMRSHDEIAACKKVGLFDLVIWVDASERVPAEGAGSFNISKKDADIIIENNGTLAEFYDKAQALGKLILG